MEYSHLVSFEQMADSLPGFIYWKDTSSTYVGANKLTALATKHKKASQLSGKTDYQLPWDMFANDYRTGDASAFAGHIIEHYQPVIINDALTITKTKKEPIYKDNKIIGVIGFSETIQNINLVNYELLKESLKDIIFNQKILKSLFHNITKREAQVLYYLIRGCGVKSIANSMFLSPRTVEKHCISLKEKFSCATKQQLINKAFKLNFHLIMPESIHLPS